MCATHWAELKAAIDARGLTSFVSTSPEQAFTKMRDGGFDPLLGAYLDIVKNGLEGMGAAFAVDNEDGTEPCPICRLVGQCTCGRTPCGFTQWISHAADGELAEAKALGLVGAA